MSLNDDIIGGIIGFVSAFLLYAVGLGIDYFRKKKKQRAEKEGIINAIKQDLDLNKNILNKLLNESSKGVIPYYNLNPDYDLYTKLFYYIDFTNDSERKIDEKIRILKIEFSQIERKINAIWYIFNGTAIEKQKYVGRIEEHEEEGFSLMPIQNTTNSNILLNSIPQHAQSTIEIIDKLLKTLG